MQLTLLAAGEPGACEPDCELCAAAERLGWTGKAMAVHLHAAGGRIGEAYARARGAWP